MALHAFKENATCTVLFHVIVEYSSRYNRVHLKVLGVIAELRRMQWACCYTLIFTHSHISEGDLVIDDF